MFDHMSFPSFNFQTTISYRHRYIRKAYEFYNDRQDISGYTLYERNPVWFSNKEVSASSIHI